MASSAVDFELAQRRDELGEKPGQGKHPARWRNSSTSTVKAEQESEKLVSSNARDGQAIPRLTRLCPIVTMTSRRQHAGL
ncbi:MAG: hypothetical protein ACPG4T_21440 [Nannocystaceae bacterium]